jgi:HlyD family secretion protein
MKKVFRSPLALFIFGIAFIAAGIVTYRFFFGAVPEQQYRLQTLEKGDISQTVSANGTINPVTLVSVGTQVSGTVKKLYVDFNSKVEKGQILLELDDALLSAQQKQSLANVQNAQASLELADANEARMRSLFAQEYVSRQELDTAVQAKKSAEAQLKLAQATVERDRANLAYSVIRSPVSGVVVDREVDVGQTVAASLQTPTLFKIAQDLSRMQIDANFAEADIGSIRVGQSVHFTVDAFPDRSFNGVVKLVRLNPTSQQNVVTYDVVINVDNPEKILLPGMTAYVNITVAERKDVLLVPNAALRYKPTNAIMQKQVPNQANDPKNSADRPSSDSGAKASKPKSEKNLRGHPRDSFSGKIYVFEKGGLKPVKVALGITDNRNTEILGGEIKVGDQVVLGEAQAAANSQAGGSPMRLRMF